MASATKDASRVGFIGRILCDLEAAMKSVIAVATVAVASLVALSAQKPATVMAPSFEVDPYWPKPLPIVEPVTQWFGSGFGQQSRLHRAYPMRPGGRDEIRDCCCNRRRGVAGRAVCSKTGDRDGAVVRSRSVLAEAAAEPLGHRFHDRRLRG